MARNDDWWPPPSTPLPAEGGIKAHSRRGAFAESWWGRRWIAVLEGFPIGARLRRGRTYARKGQVLRIEVTNGRVTADVQGSRQRPYQVDIRLAPPTRGEWQDVVARLAREARHLASLLAGEMPEAVESAFDEAGISLFPERHGDLETLCTCPDWSNPCKHIAAVYYLLAEEFDRDPFLLFRLRGLDRDELSELLAALSEDGVSGGAASGRARSTCGEVDTSGREPGAGLRWAPEALPVDPEAFWDTGAPESPPGAAVCEPDTPAALPRSLGPFPFWRGSEPMLPALEAMYGQASTLGLRAFLGEL